eukprot:CAMPEP_0182912290 /NCGR_PEP_ID=MMETSP0034_2-20130328/37437_1 /TAXON_ID=156128 /ORGANISM="Nephroselmis pyriformis, Strain CCMP717" /LENGTH=36 /DNA_ID= /DNA_START= /DNA_END= /DNA_ORIENTATION=
MTTVLKERLDMNVGECVAEKGQEVGNAAKYMLKQDH